MGRIVLAREMLSLLLDDPPTGQLLSLARPVCCANCGYLELRPGPGCRHWVVAEHRRSQVCRSRIGSVEAEYCRGPVALWSGARVFGVRQDRQMDPLFDGIDSTAGYHASCADAG